MQLIVYASSPNNEDRQLVNRITAHIGMITTEYFSALENLIQYLRNPIRCSMVAILWPQNSEELTTLINMRHLLRNMRIILILPNGDETTVSESHILRPRYVSQADGNLSDVLAVVRKMARMDKPYLEEAV